MANLIKLTAGRVDLPTLGLQYPLASATNTLQQGLAAFQDLKKDVALQSVSLSQRREVTGFLRRYGRCLFQTLFPQGSPAGLDPRAPLLLETDAHWGAYPWELLHDGDKWLALEQGVVRTIAAEVPDASVEAPFHFLAVTANPLALGGEGELAAMAQFPRSRFISSLDTAFDAWGDGETELVYRALTHAGWEQMVRAMQETPRLLLWSGFADEDCWLFESEHGESRRVESAKLSGLLSRAAKNGLQGMVINDSMGLHDPQGAARQARRWLEAGIPALIRIEGCHARVREQDYLRTLIRHLGQHGSVFTAHQAAVRRLSRRFDEGWDWSYFRLYLRGIPTGASREQSRGRPARNHSPANEPPGSTAASSPAGVIDGATHPPPRFAGRQRVLGRDRELHELAKAILPAKPPASPLIFLTGPAGSGKTVLALEAARRLHRRFHEIIYLEQRDLPSGIDELALPRRPRVHRPDSDQEMLAALARHLECGVDLSSPNADLAAALVRHLDDGNQRLVIVDGLTDRPGYDRFCDALRQFPLGCRVLLLGRQPPLPMPGFRVELARVSEDDLAVIFNPEFLERLRDYRDAGRLIGECRRDLLAARLLRRLTDWPEPGEWVTREGLPAGGKQEAKLAARMPQTGLLRVTLERVLAGLGEEPQRALAAISLLAGLVHREILAEATGMDGRTLQQALTELQWVGVVDVYEGHRYLAIPLRVQSVVGQRLITREMYATLAPRVLRGYRNYLADTAKVLQLAHRNGHPYDHPPLLSWRPGEAPQRPEKRDRFFYRLGLEQANVAELGAVFSVEADAEGLATLARNIRGLEALAGLRDLAMRIGFDLLSLGYTHGNEILQAEALNHIARALLADGRTEEAAKVLERALEILSHRTGWNILQESYLLLSRCQLSLGNREAAENLLKSAIELAYQLGDGDYLFEALRALVKTASDLQQDQAPVEQLISDAIAFLEQSDQPRPALRVRRLQAEILLDAARLDSAREILDSVLAAATDAGDMVEAGRTCFLLAECMVYGDQPEAAWNVYLDGKQWMGRAPESSPREEMRALNLISRWNGANGKYQEAVWGYQQVRLLNETLGDREGLIRTLDTLGGLYYRIGQQEHSTRCYEERLYLQATVGA